MPGKGYFIDIGVPEDYFALCQNHQPLVKVAGQTEGGENRKGFIVRECV